MGRKILLGVSVLLFLLIVGGIAGVRYFRAGGVDVHSANKSADTFIGHRADTGRGSIVYTSDFTKTAGDAWTQNTVDQTPNEQTFLGPFDNETIGLKVTSLPPHERVRVSFDLFIIDTWDGSARIGPGMKPCGPDFVEIDLAGGPNLLRATFSALPSDPGFALEAQLQSYPSPIPSKSNPMGTGAAGVCKLGYVFSFHPRNHEPVSFPMDGTYSMSYTLQHSADSIRINFAGSGLQGVADESWGLSNVKVEVLGADDQPTPSDTELQKLLDQVAGEDAVAAQAAYWKVIGYGDVTVHYLDKTAGGFGVDQAGAEAALSQLAKDHADKPALNKLISAGPTVEPVLRACVARDPSLDTAMKIALREIELQPIESPIARRAAAASRILGVINTPLSMSVQSRLTAAPRPPVVEGTAEYAAEWREKFVEKYQVGAGQNLKYIPPPLPPERAQFVEAQFKRAVVRMHLTNEHLSTAGRSEMPMIIFTRNAINVDDDVNFLRPDQSDKKVHTNFSRCISFLGAQGDSNGNTLPVIIGPEFENIDLPGDWVVKFYPNQLQKLGEISRIVAEQTGRHIRFEERTTDEMALIVHGTFAFHPLPEAPTGEQVVHVIADKLAADPSKNKPHPMKLAELLKNMHVNAGMRVFDESDAKDTVIQVVGHSSSFRRDPVTRQFPPETFEKVLENMTAQTSLTFTRELRPIKKLYAVEEGTTTLPVEK